MYAYGHLVAPSTTRPVDRNLPPRESSRNGSLHFMPPLCLEQTVRACPPAACLYGLIGTLHLRHASAQRASAPLPLPAAVRACLPARVEPPVIVQRVTEALAAKIARQLRRFRAPVPPAWRHTYSLAFAITDYKLQGKTLPRLLLSLDDNGPAPALTLAKLYVLISRVGTLDGLRFLPADAGRHGAEEARG